MADLEPNILAAANQVLDGYEPDADIEWVCVILRRFANEVTEKASAAASVSLASEYGMTVGELHRALEISASARA